MTKIVTTQTLLISVIFKKIWCHCVEESLCAYIHVFLWTARFSVGANLYKKIAMFGDFWGCKPTFLKPYSDGDPQRGRRMQGGMKKSQKSIFLPIFRPISEMIQNSQECSREYLFDHNNDEVQQLRSKKRMKMINKSNEMLLAGAERNNNSDPLPWNAPQWHPSSSRHQLMTLLYHLLRLMMLLKEKMWIMQHLRRYLRTHDIIPRHIHIMIYAQHRFYRFTMSAKPRNHFSALSLTHQ